MRGAPTWVAAAHPNYSPRQVGDALRDSARDVGARGYDARTGWGLVNVDAALAAPAPFDDREAASAGSPE
jgi:hypothetical protein